MSKRATTPAPAIDPLALIPTRVIVVPNGLKVDATPDEAQIAEALAAIAELRHRQPEVYLTLWRLFLRIQTTTNWDETYSLAGRYYVKYKFAEVYQGSIVGQTSNRVTSVTAVALTRIATTTGVPEEVLLWENLPAAYRRKVLAWQRLSWLRDLTERLRDWVRRLVQRDLDRIDPK
jgi:hypothetical protein